MRRAVVYLRVSTIDQTTANQERELREIAGRMGCEIVRVYKDHGISGTRGRDKRPAFDKLCRASRIRRGHGLVGGPTRPQLAGPGRFPVRATRAQDRPIERAQLVRLDGVKLDGDIAEALRPRMGLVGRVGKAHAVICLGVTAIRSKVMSASGANSCSVSSIFSPAFTPDGSKSPQW